MHQIKLYIYIGIYLHIETCPTFKLWFPYFIFVGLTLYILEKFRFNTHKNFKSNPCFILVFLTQTVSVNVQKLFKSCVRRPASTFNINKFRYCDAIPEAKFDNADNFNFTYTSIINAFSYIINKFINVFQNTVYSYKFVYINVYFVVYK